MISREMRNDFLLHHRNRQCYRQCAGRDRQKLRSDLILRHADSKCGAKTVSGNEKDPAVATETHIHSMSQSDDGRNL